MTDENVALLIDFENINNHDHIRSLLDELSGTGRLVVKRAFGDWHSQEKNKQLQLQSLGIELMHHSVTSSGKNASDIKLTAEAINLMHTSPAEIGTFVIASCDSDFMPLVTILRSHGKSVIVAGRKDSSSVDLVNNCDRFIDLSDLSREDDDEAAGDFKPILASTSRPNAQDGVSTAAPLPSVFTNSSKISFETRGKVFRAIRSARDNEGNVKGAKLHDTIRRIDPSFNFRLFGFDSFADFLDGVPGVEVKRSYGPQDITVKIAQNH